MLHENIVGRVT